MSTPVVIGIVTISDRVCAGTYQDLGGPAIRACLNEFIVSSWQPEMRAVPDERILIESVLIDLADQHHCSLIVTTGGTGPAPRDVTPEATEAVCDRLMPGFAEEMRRVSRLEVPTAMLSRQIAGTRGRSLILNLPGKPSSIRTCLGAVFPAVPYCLDLIGAGRVDTDNRRMASFRPLSDSASGGAGPANSTLV